MQTENENGNKIIRSIISLDTTEEEVIAVKNCIKAYKIAVLQRLTANTMKITASPAPTTTSITLSNNIKDIQTKLDKIKSLVKTTKEIVQKEGTETIARIKASVETIFDDQRSPL